MKIALAIVIVLLLVLAVVWVRTARRLDRLHRSVIQYRVTLCDALSERSRLALDYAQSGTMDAATSVLLTEAALSAVAVSGQPVVDDGLEGPSRHSQHDRCAVESTLSRTLRAVLAECPTECAELEQARTNVRLARRFHNTRVDQVRRVRTKPFVRVLKMAGTAAMPRPVDLDDE